MADLSRLIILTRRPPVHGGVDMRVLQTLRAMPAERPWVFALTAPTATEPTPERRACADEPRFRELAPSLDWMRTPGGHPTDRWYTERAFAQLCELIDREQATHVIVETLDLQAYVAPLSQRGLTVILDSPNLEANLAGALLEGRDDLLSRTLLARWRQVEARAFAAASQVWVCSESDAREAARAYPGSAPVVVVPNTVAVERYRSTGSREPATLVYPGSFAYPPNAHAVARILEEIWPRFAAQQRDARLLFVGARPTETMLAAAQRDARIEVTGEVEDVVPYLARATGLVLPLRKGGGTRLKVLEAFAAGVPVVSTAKGVEGLEVVPGRDYLAAEDDETMVAELVRVCEDAGLAGRLAHAAGTLVSERYSQQAADAAIRRAFGALEGSAGAGWDSACRASSS